MFVSLSSTLPNVYHPAHLTAPVPELPRRQRALVVLCMVNLNPKPAGETKSGPTLWSRGRLACLLPGYFLLELITIGKRRHPESRVPNAVRSQASATRVLHARLDLALVRHVTKTLALGRGELQLEETKASQSHRLIILNCSGDIRKPQPRSHASR